MLNTEDTIINLCGLSYSIPLGSAHITYLQTSFWTGREVRDRISDFAVKIYTSN